MQLQFDCLENPISFDDCDELVDVLKNVLNGWGRVRIIPDGAGDGDGAGAHLPQALIRLRRGPGGYERTSPWLEGGRMVLADPVDAVCDLLLDIERAYIATSDKLLALHAAAVEFDGGLTVFPSTHEAGKSTLAVLLAIGGARIFADDVTPIDPAADLTGVSPGLLPRLRLPLPDELSPESLGFINSHQGPKSESFLYVDMDKNALAPLGERAPVNRIILLEREPGVAAELIPASNSEILKHTIMQSIGRDISALEMLDNLNAMVGGAECLRLRYGTSEDGARLLLERYG
ncbi:MAG: hypothetical protein KAR80_08340 [Rhodospirillaceae bacterium]|nr:hypothetical protein [Rhodospirillaceae bacterium]